MLELRELSPKAIRTRDGLLDAAESLLLDGHELVSGAVADAAGVSTGTFYRYFEDKDDLLATAFARQLDRLIDTLEQALDPGMVLDQGVVAVLERVVNHLSEGYASAAPVVAVALARIRASPAIGAVYRSRHRRSVDIFATFIRRIAVAGLTRVDDVEGTAIAAVVLVQSLNHPALRQQPDPAVLHGIARALAALLGIGSPRPGDHPQVMD